MKILRFIVGGAFGITLGIAVSHAIASRNSSGTMSAINGPYVSGTTISSSQVNARFADIESELTDSASRSGKGGFTAPVRGANGTAAAPTFGFTSETASGLYRSGASDLRLSIASSDVQQWTASGTNITGTAGVTGASSFNTSSTKLLSNGTTISGLAGLWAGTAAASPSTTNYSFSSDGSTSTAVNVPTGGTVYTAVNNSPITATTGTGFAVSGVLGASGNFAINTNKFTVAASTGNTVVAGTLTVGSSGTAITGIFKGSASLTPSLVLAGATGSNSFTVTGAATDDPCFIGQPLTGHVVTLAYSCTTNTNSCTVYFFNPTAGSLTPAAGTYSCVVVH